MKKKYLILTILVFILAMINLTVTAEASNLELTPATQSVNSGSQATINIIVEDITDLRGASITLNFDATKLQYASSADGGFIPGAFHPTPPATLDNVNGIVVLDIASLSTSANGTGTILTVTFDTIGQGDANITFGETILRDSTNTEIIHTAGSGCVITIDIARLQLNPGLQGVDQGSQATLNVDVEDAVNLMGGSITLSFDPAQLQYASSSDGGFIPSATLLEQEIDNTNGSVTLDIAGFGTYNSGNGTIMNVNFTAIGTGNALVTFGSTILRDKDNNEIVHDKGDWIIVTIDPPVLNLSPATQTVPNGSQATLNVNIEDVVNLMGGSITLSFDPAQLQYASSSDGGFIPSATLLEQEIDNTNGSVTLDIAGLGTYNSGNGTLFTMLFDRIDTATTQVCFNGTILRDKDNISIYHTHGNVCSTINSLPGDFNGDGQVQFEDLMIFALAYGSTPEDGNWNPVCDIASAGGVLTPDGVINFEDLMIFALHYGETS